jgi:hypothetical protein
LNKGVVMRPDDEVNVRASEKTAAFTAGAGNAPAGDSDKTVVMAAAARPAPAFEATVVGMPTPPAGAPGYDATQKKEVGDPAFAKTDVFRPGQIPGAQNGKNDPEA